MKGRKGGREGRGKRESLDSQHVLFFFRETTFFLTTESMVFSSEANYLPDPFLTYILVMVSQFFSTSPSGPSGT